MSKIYLIGIIFSFAMTATPIVMVSNSITPFILGVPFFAFWNMFWPTMVFVFTVLHMKAIDSKKI